MLICIQVSGFGYFSGMRGGVQAQVKFAANPYGKEFSHD